MRNCKAPPLYIFLGRPYGGPRHLRQFISLCEQQLRKKILTSENLIKIGFSMVSRCCMSSMAFKLWSFIFRMFGVQWVYQRRFLIYYLGGNVVDPDIWNLTPLCLMQTIWREQNRHIFEDMDFTSSQIQASFINSLYKWSFISGLTNNNFIHSFKESAHM